MDLEPELVDVILRTKNSEEYLKKCLDSIVREIPIRKMIIVDHGSTDNTLEIASQYDMTEIYVKPDLSLGELTKLGFSMAKTEWVVVIDSDMILRSGWFKNISTFKEEADAIEGCEVNHYRLESRPRCTDFIYGRFGQIMIKRKPVLSLDLDVPFAEDVAVSSYFKRKNLKWKKVPNYLADHYPKFEGSTHRRTGTVFGVYVVHVPKKIQIQEGHLARQYNMFTTRQIITRTLLIPVNDAIRGFRRNFWFMLAYLKII